MHRWLAQHRRGMSLIELLVVVAILGLLAVTVLAPIASTTESRRTQEAARVAASFFASAQSRAIGRREWSGFRVVPAAVGSNVALDLTLVDVPPVYRGDVVPTAVQLSPAVAGMTIGTATITSGSISGAMAGAITAGNLIRFDDRDPWYEINAISTAAISFQRRDAAGQIPDNTPWPPTNQPLAFEIALSPVAYGTVVSLGEGRVIDLKWCGFIDPGTGNYRDYFTDPGSVTVLYDGTGRLRRIVYPDPASAGMLSTEAPGALFFLIGRADRAGQGFSNLVGGSDDSVGANWQYADSFWVMINPTTGSVHQAACNPSATVAADSQSFVRAFLSAGGGS